MRLADFILRDMDDILAAWEAFASTLLPAAKRMDSLACATTHGKFFKPWRRIFALPKAVKRKLRNH